MPFTSEASTVVRLRCRLRQNRTHPLRNVRELYHQKRKTNFCVRTDCLSILAALVYFEFGGYALARSCSWTNARREREKIYRLVAVIIGLKFLTIEQRPHCKPPAAV